MEENRDSPLRKQAWDYFALHASQRLTVFNFYIVLSALTTTSYVASFKGGSDLEPVRVALAALLCFFAFVFWRLDQRTKRLIKVAERALKHFEKSDPVDDVAKVFSQEETETGQKRNRFWRWPLSYSDCFGIVFLAFFVTGILGLVFGFLHYCG